MESRPLPQGRPMLVLFCGSREWTDRGAIEREMDALPPGAIVIAGGAKGADIMAETAARERGLHVAVVKPDWNRYGRKAGILRNLAMLALRPDRVVAFQRDGSSGTQHTIDEAGRRGIPVRTFLA